MDPNKQKIIDDIWGGPAPVPGSNIQVGQQRVAELKARRAEVQSAERKANRSTTEKIADVTGGKEIAQGLGQGIAAGKANKELDKAQEQGMKIQGDLIKRINEKQKKGEDVGSSWMISSMSADTIFW